MLFRSFTKSEGTTEAYVLLGAIYFFLIYLARLLKILDTPFQPRRHTNDDVDLFLLDDFAASIEAAPADEAGAAATAPVTVAQTAAQAVRGKGMSQKSLKLAILKAVKDATANLPEPPEPDHQHRFVVDHIEFASGGLTGPMWTAEVEYRSA